jgi:hypothetical protein
MKCRRKETEIVDKKKNKRRGEETPVQDFHALQSGH